MKFITIFLSVVVASSYVYAKRDVCVEYNPNDFKLEVIYNNSGHSKIKKLEAVKIYYFKDRSSTKPITLEYKVNGHTKYYKYIYCNKDGSKTTCGVECDGGFFYLNKHFGIKEDNPLRLQGDPNDESVPEINFVQKNKNIYAKGKEFKCPKKLPKAKENIVDEKYYKDNPNGLNVCYTYKEHGNYYGCFRTTKRCKDLHIQHFGKYLSKKESKKALIRCKTSKPNSNYTDNPQGLYVCYDYLSSDGEYSGCFRSKKSCKSLNKKHFGHYPNSYETKKAFKRCLESLPRR